MMKKNRIVPNIITVSLFSVLLLSACSDGSTEDLPSVYDDVELSLNNGQKWEVPKGMKTYIDSSMVIINKAHASGYIIESAPSDLLRQKENFVSNCSMEGDGHDVLHAWLMPYIGLLDKFEAGNKEEKPIVLEDLANANRLFKEYFQ